MSDALTCQECGGEGHIEVGDPSGEPTGWEDCEACGGDGIKACATCGAEAEVIEKDSELPLCRRCEQETKEAA
jgi:DnaJ-class molecular chaperone